jgi:hypothetical protein
MWTVMVNADLFGWNNQNVNTINNPLQADSTTCSHVSRLSYFLTPLRAITIHAIEID